MCKMKVSFSRKGFDSTNGAQPNAILPDGTLLPFPIPDNTEIDNYSTLSFRGQSLYQYISELKPRTRLAPDKDCHLDPDLRAGLKMRPKDWKPAFGQAEQSLSELRNHHFGVGDLFLFFGWFRQTEEYKGRLRYKPKSPHVQLIYGYMQVGEVVDKQSSFPEWLKEHPHAAKILNGSEKDCIFLPAAQLSFLPSQPAAATLHYTDEIVLTGKGMSRSKWALPPLFKNIPISHIPKQPADGSYFQSCFIGQEMIWEATDDAIEWLKQICCHIE